MFSQKEIKGQFERVFRLHPLSTDQDKIQITPDNIVYEVMYAFNGQFWKDNDAFVRLDYSPYCHVLFIHNLNVSKEFRRKGHASMIVASIEEIAKEAGITRIKVPRSTANHFWSSQPRYITYKEPGEILCIWEKYL